MKTSKLLSGLFVLFTLTTVSGFVTNISAQNKEQEREEKERGKVRCTAGVSHIYFVDSGKVISVMRPGSNGGNGYQLNILGTNVNKFEVIQMPYMTGLNIIPNYTNATSAKWGLTFAANMGQYIRAVRMKNTCNGETKAFNLDSTVQLLDQ